MIIQLFFHICNKILKKIKKSFKNGLTKTKFYFILVSYKGQKKEARY
nr:MAG TPA: hypothetical protein [Caudoviricetes sp.]